MRRRRGPIDGHRPASFYRGGAMRRRCPGADPASTHYLFRAQNIPRRHGDAAGGSAVTCIGAGNRAPQAALGFHVSAITVQLLQAASEIAGGEAALARQLGISERLLARFMADRREMPDRLLLRAVDIVLADRQSRSPPGSQLAVRSAQQSRDE